MKTQIHKFCFALAAGFLFSSAPAQAGKDDVLVVRMNGATFADATKSLRKQLKGKNLEELVLESNSPYSTFQEKIASFQPHAVVLMDNLPVSFALRYNKELAPGKGKLQGVALMALNLKETLKGNKEISAVAFEAPPYSLVTQFRFISAKPIKNVLVFYRKSAYQAEIDTATEMLKGEGITIHAVNVEQNGNKTSDVEAFIEANAAQYLTQDTQYDVHWVLLDSIIMNKKLFSTVWMPLSQKSKIPFISGLEQFAKKEVGFTVFAITPDINDLAGQAEQMIETILGSSKPVEASIEDYLSVKKILNVRKADALGWDLKKDNLSGVVLEGE